MLTGYFVGDRDPGLIDASLPLAAYTDPATFVLNSAHDPVYVDSNEELDFDPDTGQLVYKEVVGSAFVPFTIKASDIVAGTADDDRVYYETNQGDRQLSGWVHNIAPGNGEIELTYTSFAAFRTTYGSGPGSQQNDNFITFGNATPSALIPRTGSASYSGIALGGAELAGIGYDGTVHGTSDLTANFNAASFTSKLVLFTDEMTPRSIGTFLFNGNIYESGFGGNVSEYPTYSGQMVGDFYGPHADEYGYAWTVNYYTSAPGGALGNTLYGIAVGKKD